MRMCLCVHARVCAVATDTSPSASLAQHGPRPSPIALGLAPTESGPAVRERSSVEPVARSSAKSSPSREKLRKACESELGSG